MGALGAHLGSRPGHADRNVVEAALVADEHHGSGDHTWEHAAEIIGEDVERSGAAETEARLEDGGGWHSTADWLEGSAGEVSVLGGLRRKCAELVRKGGLVARVCAGFVKGGAGLLTPDEFTTVRATA
jgi:hypothetical protein